MEVQKQQFLVIETSKGNTIVTERLASGKVVWDFNPVDNGRLVKGHVVCSAQCNDRKVLVQDLKTRTSVDGDGYAQELFSFASGATSAASPEAHRLQEAAAEKTKEELAAMSKEERTAYHAARRAASQSGALGQAAGKAKAKPQMSKADRRAVQEAQRKIKEGKKEQVGDNEQMFQELRLQGLTEANARQVMKEMEEEENQEVEGSDAEPDDLLSSVRSWMKSQPGKIPEDAPRDFNLKVRFQGHVDSTPPDHLSAIVRILVEQACTACNLTDVKQPTPVCKALQPLAERWTVMLDGLYEKIPGVPRDAAEIVAKVVKQVVDEQEAPDVAKACGIVGCLMALRDVDMIDDEDMLAACELLEPKSRVLDKFIEFIKSSLEEESDEDDDDN